jgi:1-deoxy-D-xylulose-5-phosphate reductoisomerase
MGPKISVDSASLMNKGLELIEAHFLFGVEAARLDVLVHPQSIVHGLVSFADGAVTAGMAHPDMKTPIAHCLGWPERIAAPVRRLDLAELGALTFERADLARFPALGLAMAALARGGGLPTILNAANEVAVAYFLEGRIGFRDIAAGVEATCEAMERAGEAREPQSVEEALAVDHIARERARGLLEARPNSGKVRV